MQRIPVIYLLFCLVILSSACKKGLEDINVNPNKSQVINPEFLLSTSLINTAYDYQEDAYFNEPASAGRYITMVRNEGNDKFDWGPQSWDGNYSKLSVNYEMMDQAKKQNVPQYIAVGKVLEAFNFAYLSDLFGDIPYSEALRLKEDRILHPKYDQQQVVYPALLQSLKEANDQLATITNRVDATADAMYGGDPLLWRKFANSLRLRMLLRISKSYAPAFTDMQAIINDKVKYPIFESNADNAEIKYLGDVGANSWPGGLLANSFSEFDKRKPSKEIVDALQQRNDPRLGVWIAKVDVLTGGTVDNNPYVGVPNAIPAPYDYNGGADHISRLSAMFKSNSHPMVKASMMTYAEVCFILAECVQAGKITVAGKTAESLYYDGIGASMKYYGVDQVAIDAHFYDQPSVKYNGTLEQLIGQKWIAGFLKGAEAWFDNRRTGFPKFVLGPLSASTSLPKRYIYPTGERDTNNDEYLKALTQFGPDKQTTLMWYLK
ncbi:SusD/RagB family nutrient-binding outer membrane lipoprotein [Chitinophaga eiseniae]|uniref:SusD/RagB family nutrient-binding outer membrane lipoprotein n=1 Tax=Chitinophaga eiseniae TaxID=634771 RepID=A0A847SEQ9_9BACT|nr:SusD/RagB family nutrient-binding outer membrane lipoprotein [Chitinophaga eiseniae]NLR77445.1 SusD/RagB family nutrient-binding outer membrane lipoprotein [Chitinophaga eiseniae]